MIPSPLYCPCTPKSPLSFHLLRDLYFCEECEALRCHRCLLLDIVSLFCPACLAEYPASQVSESGVCARGCTECPECHSLMLASSSSLVCGMCNYAAPRARPTPPWRTDEITKEAKPTEADLPQSLASLAISQRNPRPMRLRPFIRRRCPQCRHILSTPEAMASKAKYRVKLVAMDYMPNVLVEPHEKRLKVTIVNPLEAAIDASVQFPEGASPSTETFSVGSFVEVWDIPFLVPETCDGLEHCGNRTSFSIALDQAKPPQNFVEMHLSFQVTVAPDESRGEPINVVYWLPCQSTL